MLYYRYFQSDTHRWVPGKSREPKRISCWNSVAAVQATRNAFWEYLKALPASPHSVSSTAIARDYLEQESPELNALDLISAPQLLLWCCRISEHCVPADRKHGAAWVDLNTPTAEQINSTLKEKFRLVTK